MTPARARTFDDPVGAVLGTGKDESPIDLFGERVRQKQAAFAAPSDIDDTLSDQLDRQGNRGHRHTRRIAQQSLARSAMSAGIVAEKNSVWRFGRDLGDDLPDVVDEAHVEHAIGFVEHQKFDLVSIAGHCRDEVEKPARSRDHDVDALHDRANLASHRDAADGKRRAQSQMASISLEALENLAR